MSGVWFRSWPSTNTDLLPKTQTVMELINMNPEVYTSLPPGDFAGISVMELGSGSEVLPVGERRTFADHTD